MTECLGYLAQLFDFFDHSFGTSGVADHGSASPGASAPPAA
jgi:hypothetical protein